MTVRIKRGAITYDNFNGNPYWIMSITGVGLPPIRLIKERGPQQHGATVTGFLLDERMLNVAILIDAPNEATADDYRDDLAEILGPEEDEDGEPLPVQIELTRSDTQVRQLDCFAVGVVDFPITNEDRLAGKQMVIAQFEAPDPIPYDPTLQSVTFDTSGGSGFLSPRVSPYKYQLNTGIDKVVELDYDGKWDTFPLIYITGPASDPIVTNETIDKVLDFTGTTIAAGETYTINLRYGPDKGVTDSSGTRQNAALTDASNLSTWRIVKGTNSIRVQVGDDATGETEVRMEFYNRYKSM